MSITWPSPSSSTCPLILPFSNSGSTEPEKAFPNWDCRPSHTIMISKKVRGECLGLFVDNKLIKIIHRDDYQNVCGLVIPYKVCLWCTYCVKPIPTQTSLLLYKPSPSNSINFGMPCISVEKSCKIHKKILKRHFM